MPGTVTTTADALTIQRLGFHRSGRMIVLVGAVHSAPPAFWAATQAYLEGFEVAGGAVHYEGTRQKSRHTPSTWLKHRLVLAQTTALRETFAKLGFVWQTPDGIRYHDSWENHDTDGVHVLRNLRLWKLLISSTVARTILRLTRTRARNAVLISYLSALGTPAGPSADDSTLLDERNELAIAAALTADRDVALLWGTGHLSGMAELLLAEGFELVWRDDVEYVTREHLSQYGIDFDDVIAARTTRAKERQ